MTNDDLNDTKAAMFVALKDLFVALNELAVAALRQLREAAERETPKVRR